MNLDSMTDQAIQAALRERHRAATHRENRDILRKLPKRHALMGNCVAPGVEFRPVMHNPSFA